MNGSDMYADNENIFLNVTRKATKKVPEPPEYIVTSITAIYILIFVIGIIGNAVVVIVVGCSRNMRTTVNIYMVNLCVADFLVLLVCMPPILVELHTKDVWYFGPVMCKIVPFLEVVVASASVFTIVAITTERFRVVYKPLSVTSDNLAFVIKSIIVIWICAIVLSSPILVIVIYKATRLKDGTPVNVCRMPAIFDWQKSYFVSLSFFNYIIPCFVIMVLNFFLYRKLYMKRGMPFDIYKINHREKKRLQKQVMHIIWSIVCVFFLCHLPFRAYSLWMIFGNKEQILKLGLEFHLLLLYYSRMFLFLNHAVNPILYNFVSTKFRRSFMNLLYPRKREFSIMTNERHRNTDYKHNQAPLTGMMKNETSKETTKDIIQLVQIYDNDKSSSSSSVLGRGKINDFSALYIKHIEEDSESNTGRCQIKLRQSNMTSLLEAHSTDSEQSENTGLMNSEGCVVSENLMDKMI